MIQIASVIFFLLSIFCIQTPLSGHQFEKFDPEGIRHFEGTTWGEDSHLVLRTFPIVLPDITHPYNPSILPYKDGYVLSFRYDPPWDGKGTRAVKIGLMPLDANMVPQSTNSSLIDTQNPSSEDPRLFFVNNKPHVVYTHVTQKTPSVCNIAISELDFESLSAVQSIDMKYKNGNTEKNWTPFVYRTVDQEEEEAYLIYRYVPHEILRLELPVNGKTQTAYKNQPPKGLVAWQRKWGEIRGGTQAIKIGNEYLVFFHSSFLSKSKKIRYYVMGAVTFESEPPFRFKRISPHPIFFKGIYSTPVIPTLWFYPRNHIRVIFPGGVVRASEQRQDVLYVVCGENDASIKCVVLDTVELLRSLVSVD